MIYRRASREFLFDAANYTVLLALAFLTLYPFVNQLGISLSATSDRVMLFPSELSFESYRIALNYDAIWSGFRNTAARTGLGTVLSLIFTSAAAYALSKPTLPLRRTWIAIILVTMLFGGGLIPNYLLIRQFGMIDTIWALVVPGMISGFNIYIMTAFFRNIPASLEESAKVDGFSDIGIFIRIVAPLSLPVFATIGLWVAVSHWNEWYSAMIYTRDPDKYVLQVVLRKILVENQTSGVDSLARLMTRGQSLSSRQLQATIIMISTIPMIMLYPFIQRFFVRGIMIGAVKE